MKKMIRTTAISLICAAVACGQANAQAASGSSAGITKVNTAGNEVSTQEEIRISRHRVIEFKNESKSSETKVTMTDEFNYLNLKIAAILEDGSAIIEIFDPGGEKKGGFTVKSDGTHTGPNSSVKEQVRGELVKNFRYPAKGDWIIRARPTAAIGRVEIQIFQEYYKGLDYIQPEKIR
ncbi:MAG: hypothetical protein R6V75_11305 [Bacteroidales bacterium]